MKKEKAPELKKPSQSIELFRTVKKAGIFFQILWLSQNTWTLLIEIILLHTLVSKHVDNFDEHASGYSKFQIPGFYILIRLVLTFVDIFDCVIETY